MTKTKGYILSLGVALNDLASRSEVTRNTVANWMNKPQLLTIDKINILSDILAEMSEDFEKKELIDRIFKDSE